MCLFSSKFILQIRVIKFTIIFLSSWKEKIKTWNYWKQYKIIYFSVVTQSRLTLCYPMDCSTPGFPVHHQLPELAQTHVHWVGDAIQPSHPLSSPSLPALNLSQHLFWQNVVQWRREWQTTSAFLPWKPQSGEGPLIVEIFRLYLLVLPCGPSVP